MKPLTPRCLVWPTSQLGALQSPQMSTAPSLLLPPSLLPSSRLPSLLPSLMLSLLLTLLPAGTHAQAANEPAVPRDGCEFCGAFDAPATVSSSARIAPIGEPGTPLVITGTVYRPQSATPAANVLLYAYHTDATGHHRQGGNATGMARRHGVLRGWARTDAAGHYRFETIRPGPYPGRPDPAHVHITVTPPGGSERWIAELVFTDDPRLTPAVRAQQPTVGGSGVARVTTTSDGVQHVTRDIVLERVSERVSERGQPSDGRTAVVRTLDIDRSIVRWRGTKFGGRGSHEGTIRLRRGELTTCATARAATPICGGVFEIDMTTIDVTDIPPSDDVPRTRLITHLKGPDFFDVAQHPVATFTLSSVSTAKDGKFRVRGALALSGVTRDLDFLADTTAGGAVVAIVTIDRTRWGIRYRWDPVRNEIVDDDITLGLHLAFRDGAANDRGR